MRKLHYFLLAISILCFYQCSPKTAKRIDSSEEMSEMTKQAPPAPEAPVPPPPPPLPPSSSNHNTSPIPLLPTHEGLVSGVLSNGMKYFILKNAKPENRAELRLAVDAGSMQEDDNQQGLAHFVEHMAFNGTKNFEKNELVDYLESVGTRFGPDLNAYTSFDETVYMLQVRTDVDSLFTKGMLILEDWAGSISFDHEEIDKERGVVESEWRTRLSPQQRMQKEYFPKMYKGSRYAKRLPIGDPEIIRNAEYSLFKKFYDDWYQPDAMAVIVVGDVDIEETKQMIISNFSDIESRAPKREKESNEVPDHQETIVSIVTDPEAPFTQVQMMYKHDREKTKDIFDYKQVLTRSLYNAILNERLTELSKSKNPPFIFAYSGYSGDVGELATYSSFLTVAEDKIMDGFKAVVRENERVLRFGFNQSELDRQKTALLDRFKRSSLEKDKTDSRRYASQLVYHFLDENPFTSEEQRLSLANDLIPQITLDELNQLAEQWISDENRVVIVMAPEKEDVLIPEENQILEFLEEVKKEELDPYEDEVVDVPLFDRELISGKILEKTILENTEIVKYTLSNEVEVYLKQTDFKNDEVLMSAYSPGGTVKYNDEEYIHAEYAGSLVREMGVGDFSSSDLNKLLTGKKVSVSPFIGQNFEGISGSFSPDDMETFFQLMYLTVTEPRKDEEAFSSFITKQKGFFENILSNPDYYFMDYGLKYKTNNHPRSGFTSPEQMDKLNLDKVLNYYKERFANASDFTFSFVGNANEEEFEKMIVKYIASLPSKGELEELKPSTIHFKKGRISENISKGKAEKTQVELFYHGDFNTTPKAEYSFNSMIQVLRIKMRESLREDKGGVYGVRVSGYIDKIKKEYQITVAFNCDPGREQELIETALQDIENAKENGSSEKDLNKVKETQIQGMTKNLKENRYWSRKIADALRYNENPDHIGMKNLEKFVEELTSDDIKAAAGSYFGENRIQLMMTPMEKPSN